MDRDGPRLAVIVEDVSSRKQAETVLAATQSELARVSRFTSMGELAASIAHEVNQPLSAIVTNSQAALRWLSRETPDHKEVVAALKRVNRDANVAGSVISRIRNFLGRGVMKRSVVCVSGMLDDSLNMLKTLLLEGGIQSEVDVSPELPTLLADQIQLQQVLLNLLVNAIEAMRERDVRILAVSISSDADDGIVFSVKDSGPGIPRGMEEKIFDALFSTKCEGLGMGLAISRTIVENHGGRLRIATTSADGSSFVFNIPVSL